MRKKSKYYPLLEELKLNLPTVFKKAQFNKAFKVITYGHSQAVDQEPKEAHIPRADRLRGAFNIPIIEKRIQTPFGIFNDYHEFSNRAYSYLRTKLYRVAYRTVGNVEAARLYTFEDNDNNIEGLDFSCGFINGNTFFSHYSALYLLGLTDQRPNSYFISKEKQYANNEDFVYDEEIGKIVFRKPARETKRYIEYNGSRIYILERQIQNYVGIEEIDLVKHSGKSTLIYCTNLERTLLDCIVSPQYAGGISNVYECFRKSKIKVNKLYEAYKELNPSYPYWQSIGFMLDTLGLQNESTKWMGKFNNEKVPFFAAREYRSDWSLNEKWKVYYPDWLLL